ncbi:hypothetical protein GBAR_LOCUS26753 [Geodia barretti]|uniref:Uncharacterized protein n=1 Tax=Geodia barretti TaxID=519541 RepID=A0AA35TIB2_GEOBA|nr:hypothetical protein GBAR_LOCUS26753 [Geodia barretti]
MVGKEKERPRERSSRYDYHRRHSSRSRDVGSSHDQQQAKPLSKDVSFQPPASLPDEVQYIRRQRLLLRTLRRRSGLRRKLLAKEFGTSDISTIVSSRRENDENRRLRYRLNPTKYRATSRHEPPSSRKERERGRKRDDQDIVSCNCSSSSSSLPPFLPHLFLPPLFLPPPLLLPLFQFIFLTFSYQLFSVPVQFVHLPQSLSGGGGSHI